MGVGEIQCEGLLAKNIFSGTSGELNGLRVEFIRRGNQDSIDLPVLQHLFEAAVGGFDFQLRRHLARTLLRGIGDSDQSRLRHQAAKILRVTLAHFSDAKNANSKVSHSASFKPFCGRKITTRIRGFRIMTNGLRLPVPDLLQLSANISSWLQCSVPAGWGRGRTLRLVPPRTSPNIRS